MRNDFMQKFILLLTAILTLSYFLVSISISFASDTSQSENVGFAVVVQKYSAATTSTTTVATTSTTTATSATTTTTTLPTTTATQPQTTTTSETTTTTETAPGGINLGGNVLLGAVAIVVIGIAIFLMYLRGWHI